MVLVAHTDDETLGCGATAALLAGRGWDVDVVILTDGVITARGGDPIDNREQCDQACELLGIKPPTLLGFPDQQLDRESLTDLSTAVADLGRSPDLIITHSDHDLNVDHRLTAGRLDHRRTGRRRAGLELHAQLPDGRAKRHGRC